MAPNSRNPLKATYAGVSKAKKYNTNKYQTSKAINHHDQSSHDSAPATLLPAILHEEIMLASSDVNFTPGLTKAMVALAIRLKNPNEEITASASNPATFLDSLPTEILIQISNEMAVEDQIRMAFIYPHLFMNDNRFNIFTADAYHQLNVRTYILCELPPAEWLECIRTLRHPLILDAISPESGSFSVDQVDLILNQYEKVYIDNQIDSQAFLNSVFPDRRPANVPPPSTSLDPHALKSPLHMAVEAGRGDLVQLLIQRGADVNCTFRQPAPTNTDKLLTPFQWGITFGASQIFGSLGLSRARILQVEEALLTLVHTSTITAYTADFEVTRETTQSIIGGMDRLALLLLERGETIVSNNRNSERHQISRNGVLQLILTGPFPMPQTIRFLLDHGGNFRFIDRPVMTSVTVTALPSEVIENISTALRWELETGAPELNLAISEISRLATKDTNLDILRPLANEFISRNHRLGQTQLLGYSIIAGTNAPLTREFLLTAVGNEVLDGEALRVAIRYRDRNTASRVLQSMSLRGQSIDEPLQLNEGDPNIGHWANTPLTYALAQENYFEAATLLSIGADPNQIPPNIRHRVRVVRDRINAGYINDIAFFVFRGLNIDAYPVPVLREAEWSLNYVFSRLLDDSRYPMPQYFRTKRHANLPLDHPNNDSEREDNVEDDPILKGEYP
ncbi:hypothetical protein FHL15_003496 [Xylaria flabelliformis]|uniref:Uncharacterized protein n=1 Tax=Xylaria flabelliformis TaxID=2512241 RepID=A0A553I5R0_9PEZI|nr:hypothetical protein FHL15_003496 [Xylaria flabelliformis]